MNRTGGDWFQVVAGFYFGRLEIYVYRFKPNFQPAKFGTDLLERKVGVGGTR